MNASVLIRWSMSVLLILGSTGCVDLRPTREAPAEGPIPPTFQVGLTAGKPAERWWETFDSDALNELIERAMQENLSLRQLWARLDQAGALAIQAESYLYPQIDYTGDTSYRRTVTTVETQSAASTGSKLGMAAINGVTSGITQGVSQQVSRAISGTGTTGTGGTGGSAGSGSYDQGYSPESRRVAETKLFGLGLATSWELDIWGRISSAYESAQRDVRATHDELEATAITLAAEIAERWLLIVESQELQRILNEQLETNRTYLELVELRFRKSQVSALDVFQQRQAVDEVQKQIPLIEAQEQLQRHALAVLLGEPPGVDLMLDAYDLSEVPVPPTVGIPANLLRRRPDVRAARARLEAADYRVAAARADQLPAIRLSGGIGYSAADIANVFDDWYLNLAAGLTGPLFDGQRREAEVERTRAVVEERLADYRLTVLTAIREVEDALVRARQQRFYLDALQRQLADAGAALREASQRYQKGLNDYLPVLTALERTQALTRNLVTGRRELLVYRIDLYRALGGMWPQDLTAPPRLSEERPLAKANES